LYFDSDLQIMAYSSNHILSVEYNNAIIGLWITDIISVIERTQQKVQYNVCLNVICVNTTSFLFTVVVVLAVAAVAFLVIPCCSCYCLLFIVVVIVSCFCFCCCCCWLLLLLFFPFLFAAVVAFAVVIGCCCCCHYLLWLQLLFLSIVVLVLVLVVIYLEKILAVLNRQYMNPQAFYIGILTTKDLTMMVAILNRDPSPSLQRTLNPFNFIRNNTSSKMKTNAKHQTPKSMKAYMVLKSM